MSAVPLASRHNSGIGVSALGIGSVVPFTSRHDNCIGISALGPAGWHQVSGAMLFTLARQVLIAFAVVSALMAVFSEQGLGGKGGMAAIGQWNAAWMSSF